MKLEKWALVAEIIGAMAVVLSLIFVGVQIRQNSEQTAMNTNAVYINAYQDLVSQINESLTMLAENPQLAELMARINAGGEPQDAGEAQQYSAYVAQIFRKGDLAYRQYDRTLIDEDTLGSALLIVRVNTLSRQGQEIWANASVRFHPGYVEFVNSMNDDCPPGWDCVD